MWPTQSDMILSLRVCVCECVRVNMGVYGEHMQVYTTHNNVYSRIK